jgi:hypothetical protein
LFLRRPRKRKEVWLLMSMGIPHAPR